MPLLLLSGFSLGAVAVLILIIARDFGHLSVAKAFIGLGLAGACFLVQPHIPVSWHPVADSLSTMVPALFWVLCQHAFSFRPRIFSLSGVLALYTFTAPAISRIVGLEVDKELISCTYWQLIGWSIPAYCEYIIIGLGLWTVVANWSDDLVESSRKMRSGVLIVTGICVLMVVVPLNTGLTGRWLPYSSSSLISLFIAYFVLQGKRGVLFGDNKPPQQAPEEIPAIPQQETDFQQKDTQALKDIMSNGFYRTEHLTLKLLAKQLQLPEYKTRALINQTLGYRNFNDYINQLRIRDAAQLLLDDRQCPILNISLDVGYRTLSSFNRAFKDIKNMSPSEYRQQDV